MSTPADHTTTTLGTIIVEKTQLLTKLRDNRKAHAEIYEAACAGYWVQTQAALEEKKGEFTVAVEEANLSFAEQCAKFGKAIGDKARQPLGEFQSTSNHTNNWTLDFVRKWLQAFPVNHLEDYDRAINMLEFSVADKVALEAADFDAYVRNNWKWKEEFANSNLGFVRCVTGAMFAQGTLSDSTFHYAVSGCAGL